MAAFSLILISVLSFGATTVLIVCLRPIATRFGLVDIPNERKVHRGRIPLVGGPAIFLAVLISHETARFVFGMGLDPRASISLYAAGGILIIAGMFDDYHGLSPTPRLVIEVIAALIMVYGAGVYVEDLGTMSIGGEPVYTGWFGIPFTVFATVALINAVNMSDGLDGLAGSLVIIPIIGFIVSCVVFGEGLDLTPMAIVAASVLAFLMFNVTVPGRRRALIFLGDSGSMFLGLVLAWFAISLSQEPMNVITPSAVLWFLTMPVYDTVCMTCRRIMRRRKPFSADKEHLHHVFLLAGFTVTETVGIMAGLAAIGVAIGLLATKYQLSDLLLSGAFLFLGLLYFWVILRSWTVMRFLRRSICRRREIADRRTSGERRKGGTLRSGQKERRSMRDRRKGERRKQRSPAEPPENS